MGAKKAIDEAYLLSGKTGAYVYKEILHNAEIMFDLESRGIGCANDISDLNSGDTVIIRAHGEGVNTFKQLDENNIKYIDATCIKVKRIHDLVLKKYNNGYAIIIVGKKNHPEVLGTNGWCEDKAYIVEKIQDVDNLKILNDKIYAVAQTTINESIYLEIIDYLITKHPHLEYENTICSAPKLIQKYALELASRMDIMIVVGGSNSSNTKELYNICSSVCNSYFCSSLEDLNNIIKDNNFNKETKIGMTGGASTPKSQIDRYAELLEDEINKILV